MHNTTLLPTHNWPSHNPPNCCITVTAICPSFVNPSTNAPLQQTTFQSLHFNKTFANLCTSPLHTDHWPNFLPPITNKRRCISAATHCCNFQKTQQPLITILLNPPILPLLTTLFNSTTSINILQHCNHSPTPLLNNSFTPHNNTVSYQPITIPTFISYTPHSFISPKTISTCLHSCSLLQ